MPPENGGKPCEGPAIRKRPCNTQPCPIMNNKKNEKFEKPIVKVLRISNRPSRYDKCHLKENDIFAVFRQKGVDNLLQKINSNPDFLNTEDAGKILARIIMNNKSISLYKDENLNSNLLTLNLETTKFVRLNENKNCFFLLGKITTEQVVICNMEFNTNFVEEWDYDFNLFKNQCDEVRPVVKLDSEMSQKLKEKIKKNQRRSNRR